MATERILITGGTGFAGTHLVAALRDAGQTDLHVTSLSGGTTRHPSLAATVHQLDLTDSTATAQLWQDLQPTQIYHLASFAAPGASFEQAAHVLNNNTTLQLSVLEATRRHTPQARMLAIGSAEEYGLVDTAYQGSVDENCPLNPANPYGVSKVTQDLLAQCYHLSYQLDIVRVRPFNHIGEGQSPQFALPSFAQQIVAIERGQQKTLRVGSLEAIRDFTDVKDMVQAYLLLMARGQAGEVYNVGSGQGYKMKDIVAQLCELATVEIPLETDTTKIRPLDLPRLVADNSKITQLGWRPQSDISPTLARILADWRSRS